MLLPFMRKDNIEIFELEDGFRMTGGGKDVEIPLSVSRAFWQELIAEGFEVIDWNDPDDDFLGYVGVQDT